LILFIELLFLSLDTSLVIRTYTIESDKVLKDIKIALVTDLHSCDYGPEQKILIEAINKEKPDVVLLGGDIVDDILPENKADEFLFQITNTKAYPVYYVSGNHEFWSGRIDSIKEKIESYGITILEGDTVTTVIKDQTICINGIDDPEIGELQFENQMNHCFKSSDNKYFSILLAHRPERIDTYLRGDFDLILAGHAHGGQCRIPGILNGFCAPNQGFFPRYAGGEYGFDHTTMIVSRGLSIEKKLVPRIFNPPELLIIDIDSVE